jgi:hypothetical protein
METPPRSNVKIVAATGRKNESSATGRKKEKARERRDGLFAALPPPTRRITFAEATARVADGHVLIE